MRKLLNGLCIAVSLYSAIPVPQREWKRENMQYALCFFPLVGVVAALAVYGWLRICVIWAVTPALFAAAAVLLPLLISGGIHMDGWIDAMDALCSHADIPRKLEIMKDPHIGAFGVMGCAGYLLLQFALWQQVYLKPGLYTIPLVGMVLSRCLNAASIALFPSAKSSGLAYLFAEHAARRAVVIACAFWGAMAMVVLGIYAAFWGAAAFGACLLYFACHRRLCLKQFGGNTGDLAGALLQCLELICLLFAAAGGVLQ